MLSTTVAPVWCTCLWTVVLGKHGTSLFKLSALCRNLLRRHSTTLVCLETHWAVPDCSQSGPRAKEGRSYQQAEVTTNQYPCYCCLSQLMNYYWGLANSIFECCKPVMLMCSRPTYWLTDSELFRLRFYHILTNAFVNSVKWAAPCSRQKHNRRVMI